MLQRRIVKIREATSSVWLWRCHSKTISLAINKAKKTTNLALFCGYLANGSDNHGSHGYGVDIQLSVLPRKRSRHLTASASCNNKVAQRLLHCVELLICAIFHATSLVPSSSTMLGNPPGPSLVDRERSSVGNESTLPPGMGLISDCHVHSAWTDDLRLMRLALSLESCVWALARIAWKSFARP